MRIYTHCHPCVRVSLYPIVTLAVQGLSRDYRSCTYTHCHPCVRVSLYPIVTLAVQGLSPDYRSCTYTHCHPCVRVSLYATVTRDYPGTTAHAHIVHTLPPLCQNIPVLHSNSIGIIPGLMLTHIHTLPPLCQSIPVGHSVPGLSRDYRSRTYTLPPLCQSIRLLLIVTS